MTEIDKAWAQELQRRITVYDECESRSHWPGKMTAADYAGLAVLTIVLVVGFSVWSF
jgi:hypothetical protein